MSFHGKGMFALEGTAFFSALLGLFLVFCAAGFVEVIVTPHLSPSLLFASQMRKCLPRWPIFSNQDSLFLDPPHGKILITLLWKGNDLCLFKIIEIDSSFPISLAYPPPSPKQEDPVPQKPVSPLSYDRYAAFFNLSVLFGLA